MKLKPETRIAYGFILSFLILIIISIVTFKSLISIAENADQTKKSQEILTNLSMMLSAITEAESAQRGRTLTGDEKFLETFFYNETTVNHIRQRLAALVTDNVFQEQKLKELEPHIMQRMERLKYLVDLNRNEGFEAAREEVASGKGKMIQDKIRNIITEMQNNEFETLLQNSQRDEQSIFRGKAIIVAGIITELVIILLAISFISVDFKNRRLLEKELLAKNQQLQQMNAEKDKFFSIIAHDLKSPFNSIMGFSELLVERAAENDHEEIENYAAIILQSSERAMTLLENLMLWSRSQTGRIEYSPAHFELVTLINEVLSLLSDAARQKSITLKSDLPAYLTVFADKPMISTVLRNLITNAVKFTKPGGNILVMAKETGAELLVSVKDDGVGLSEDAREKLFRVGENYTTKGTGNEQGTGLGLILCKEFIDKHGGKIWAESEQQSGSTFSFSLPMKK